MLTARRKNVSTRCFFCVMVFSFLPVTIFTVHSMFKLWTRLSSGFPWIYWGQNLWPRNLRFMACLRCCYHWVMLNEDCIFSGVDIAQNRPWVAKVAQKLSTAIRNKQMISIGPSSSLEDVSHLCSSAPRVLPQPQHLWHDASHDFGMYFLSNY